MLGETVELVLKGLDERERQIAALSLQGWTVAEIKTEVRCSQSKIYRVLNLIRVRLERARDANA
jgi:DNA-directed RNA polymerase specialized sigma subunit